MTWTRFHESISRPCSPALLGLRVVVHLPLHLPHLPHHATSITARRLQQHATELDGEPHLVVLLLALVSPEKEDAARTSPLPALREVAAAANCRRLSRPRCAGPQVLSSSYLRSFSFEIIGDKKYLARFKPKKGLQNMILLLKEGKTYSVHYGGKEDTFCSMWAKGS